MTHSSRSEGQPEGCEGQPEGSEGQPEGSESLPGGTYGCKDVRTDVRTDVRNFSLFYRTMSPLGAAAQKERLRKRERGRETNQAMQLRVTRFKMIKGIREALTGFYAEELKATDIYHLHATLSLSNC